MKINTIRFGEVDIDQSKIITFRAGLPGLEDQRRFAVLQFAESNPIVWLQSVESPEVCLPVVDSFAVLPDYAFNLSDEDVKSLELTGPEELHVLSVMVIPDDIENMTLNQAAPIVVNTKTGFAQQIILNTGEFNVRAPIFAQISKLIKEGEADAGAVPSGQ